MDNNEFKLFFVSISISVSGYGIVLCFCLHLTIVDVSPVVDAMPLIFFNTKHRPLVIFIFCHPAFPLSRSVFCRWIFSWSKCLVHFSLAYLFAGCSVFMLSSCVYEYIDLMVSNHQITLIFRFNPVNQWLFSPFSCIFIFVYSLCMRRIHVIFLCVFCIV